MKKFLAIIAICCLMVSAFGCGEEKTIDGVKYGTYGLLNSNDMKNPEIEYGVIWGNVFLGAILFETIIAPIYFFGFSLFEPVGKKQPIKGKIN